MKHKMLVPIGILLFVVGSRVAVAQEEKDTVDSLKITILSTMLTDATGIGEWGFAALVEADGHRILFDTGRLPDTVLENAKALGVELADVEDVILSHNHFDHTGGPVNLRRSSRRRARLPFPEYMWAEGFSGNDRSARDGSACPP